MNSVFADTWYFLALINPRDASHARVKDFSRENAPRLVTTTWILTEVADGLSRSVDRAQFEPLGRRLLTTRRRLWCRPNNPSGKGVCCSIITARTRRGP